MIENVFHLKENNTTIRKEVIGGLITFFAMAYIIFVNPSYLSQTGMDFYAVMLATCISSAIGCFLTGFLANVPFAQAPGMGLNAFFTYTVCFGMGYTWQQGLAIVFISGIIFLVITLSPLRSKIIEAIPSNLKAAISAGIGLFIAFIGLLNAGIIVTGDGFTDLGRVVSGAPLLALIGILLTGVLIAFKVKGAILISIIVTTILGVPMGVTIVPNDLTMSGISLAPTFMKLTFSGLAASGIIPLVTTILTFTMCDCFDTVGTLIGTAGANNMLDEEGNLPRGDKALIADAAATCVGALFGTSTVTTFVESSTGIAEGARTGLSSVVTGILFLIACIFAPIAGMIPSAATAPALIIVGVYLMANSAKIDWSDMEIAIPSFLTIAMMPFAYSISDGIGFGFISYVLIKIFRGKGKEVHPLLYALSALFVLMYII